MDVSKIERTGFSVKTVFKHTGEKPKPGDRLIHGVAENADGPIAEVLRLDTDLTGQWVVWIVFMVMDTDAETLWQKENNCFNLSERDVMGATYAN